MCERLWTSKQSAVPLMMMAARAARRSASPSSSSYRCGRLPSAAQCPLVVPRHRHLRVCQTSARRPSQTLAASTRRLRLLPPWASSGVGMETSSAPLTKGVSTLAGAAMATATGMKAKPRQQQQQQGFCERPRAGRPVARRRRVSLVLPDGVQTMFEGLVMPAAVGEMTTPTLLQLLSRQRERARVTACHCYCRSRWLWGNALAPARCCTYIPTTAGSSMPTSTSTRTPPRRSQSDYRVCLHSPSAPAPAAAPRTDAIRASMLKDTMRE